MIMTMRMDEARKVNAEISKCVDLSRYAHEDSTDKFWMFRANLIATLYYLGDYENAEELFNDLDLILETTYRHEVVYLMKHNTRDEMCETCPYCPDFPNE